MIGSVDNKPGWRCDSCKQVPHSWWTSGCPRGCGKTIMACGRCAAQAQVEDELEAHLATCAYEPLNVKAISLGSVPPLSTKTLMRAGARAGAQLGVARSANHGLAGGALGAALGALAGHVLKQPEIQPVIDLLNGLREPVQDVFEVVRPSKKP